MRKQVLMAVVLLSSLSSALTSRSQNLSDTDALKKGDEVMASARKAIGIPTGGVKAFRYRAKSSMATKTTTTGLSFGDQIVEIRAVAPDSLQIVRSIEDPMPSVSISTWNGPKYKKVMETHMGGVRNVTDVTESAFRDVDADVRVGKLSNDKLKNLKKIAAQDPKTKIQDEIWGKVFPLLLSHPFEQNLEYRYAGKAESSKRIADVVDVKSSNMRRYRLLFDSVTNHLLMMIESFEGEDGTYEVKYYFSNRESINNVLIPKSVKIESKFTRTGKDARLTYKNIDILELNLKPEFKKDAFDIK